MNSALRFAGFELDQQRSELRGPSGEAVRLRPKTFEMLRLFASHPGRILSKQMLMTAVWPNVHVGEDNLFQCVREIRAALGDDQRQLIKAVSGRGYMLDAEVADIEVPVADSEPRPAAKIVTPRPSLINAENKKNVPGKAQKSRLNGRAALIVTLLTVAGIALALTLWQPATVGKGTATITVLPIASSGNDPIAARIASNVTGQLSDGLSKIENIAVVIPSQGKTQADFVVSGEFHQNDESWSLRVRMNETATGEVKWSDSVSIDMAEADTQPAQSRISAGAGHNLALRINELLNAKVRASTASSAKAAVEQATAQINQTSPERFRVAQGMLEKALSDNPGDIDLEVALAGLMLRGVQMAWYSAEDNAAAVRKSQSILEHALRAAPNSVPVNEAYCRLLSTTNQFSASLVACARILTLDPWNGMALYLIGLSQLKLGRFEDALATFKQADQFDTPRVSRWTWTLGASWACMLMGKPEDALPWLQRSISITPASGRAYFLLAAIYQQLGRFDEAQAATAKSHGHQARLQRAECPRAKGEYEPDIHGRGRQDRQPRRRCGIAGTLVEHLAQGGTATIPAPRAFTIDLVALVGDDNSVLELDESPLGVLQRGFDRHHHPLLQRLIGVIAVVTDRTRAGQARRFVGDETHAVGQEVGVILDLRLLQARFGNFVDLSADRARPDHAECRALDSLDLAQQILKFCIRFAKDRHAREVANITTVVAA